MASDFWTKIRKLYRSLIPTRQVRPIHQPSPMTIPTTQPPERLPVPNPENRPLTPDPEVGALDLSSKIELLHQAGQQLLMVEMVYDGQSRLVEPYSFREKSTGRLFYGFCSIHGKIHSFRPEKIQTLKLTNIRYSPKWTVEL